MTQHSPFSLDSTGRKPPSEKGAVTSGFVLVATLLGLLVAVSYPVYTAAALVALVAAAVLLRTGGPTLGRRLHGRMTELDVPGVGTVQIRVHGR